MGEARRKRARNRQMERDIAGVVEFTLAEARASRQKESQPRTPDVLVVTHEPFHDIWAKERPFLRALNRSDAPYTRAKTPAADWREQGEPDPHAGIYDGKERHEIMGGQFTDDEVAYKCGMASGRDLESISTLHMAKDRIRWLSRMLVAAEKRIAELEGK